ncbi:DUF4276 family protein [Rhizobium ruizarguesonis]
MKRVCVVCEGATEVQFVLDCVGPYLIDSNIHAYPTLLQAPSGNHRGGRVTVDRLARFISHQYDECDYITTFVDFYGFQDANGRTRAQLETAILDELLVKRPGIDRRFVLPYLQMHEFEALLFSDISKFEWVLDGWNADVRNEFEVIRNTYGPEDINNSPETAPSKRILSIFPAGTYSKTEHGPLIAQDIGIDAIRAACPGFDAWLSVIESWRNVQGGT